MRSLESQFDIDIDVSEFVELAGRSADAVDRAAKRALNNIAFNLKKQTPEILDKLIDRPTPFTRSPSAVNVQRASSAEEGAILYINRLQSQYLGVLEYGGVKRRGIRGAYAAGNRATDQYGNIRRLFRRGAKLKELIKNSKIRVRNVARNADGSVKRNTRGRVEKAKSEYQVGRYFVGRLRNGRNPRQVGLWERGRDNRKVRMIAEFVRVQQYRTPLGLHDEWQSRYDEVYRDFFYNALNYELGKTRSRKSRAAS